MNESIQSECYIKYKGNLLPNVHWYGPQPFEQMQTNTYSAMKTIADRSMDQGSWRSVVNFTVPVLPPFRWVSNAPVFEMIYTTPTVTVHCE